MNKMNPLDLTALQILLGKLDPPRFSKNGLQPDILLVDDEPRMLESCVALLKNQNYRLAVASNGQQAIAQLSQNEFNTAEASFKSAKANYNAAVQGIKGGQASVQTARASLEKANKDLGRTVIIAPMDGVVSLLNVKRGEPCQKCVDLVGALIRAARIVAIGRRGSLVWHRGTIPRSSPRRSPARMRASPSFMMGSRLASRRLIRASAPSIPWSRDRPRLRALWRRRQAASAATTEF